METTDIEKAKEVALQNATKISTMTNFTPEQVMLIKSTVAKGTNDNELAYFLSVAKSVNLNPMLKQIWCYKDNKGNLLMFAGKDGFLAIAQRDVRWNGMTSVYVCENDVFEFDVPNNIVKHSFKAKDRGAILGAYAILKPKGCDLATIEWADINTYDKKQFVWNSHKGDMIMKVAEIHGLKKAHGIDGLNDEFDFNIQNNVALPLETASPENDLDNVKKKIIDALATYKGDDKKDIQKMCADKAKANEFDYVFARETAKQLGITL